MLCRLGKKNIYTVKSGFENFILPSNKTTTSDQARQNRSAVNHAPSPQSCRVRGVLCSACHKTSFISISYTNPLLYAFHRSNRQKNDISSLWTNAWLDVLPTSILLAAKEDLCDTENNFHHKYFCCWKDSSAYTFFFVLIRFHSKSAFSQEGRKKIHDTCACVGLDKTEPTAVVSHLITEFT